jgi:hypothetical protein
VGGLLTNVGRYALSILSFLSSPLTLKQLFLKLIKIRLMSGWGGKKKAMRNKSRVLGKEKTPQ